MMTRRLVLGGLLCAVVVSGGACSRSEAPAPEAAKPAATATKFDKLLGRWARSDGDYMLELRAATAAGQLTAGYFNPSPINVEKAEARAEGGDLKVFVVLRDINYPGCTYQLTLDAQRDVLFGTYFQASQQQSYEIAFTRLK
jgi:hypothetical protein